jgi:hypothetical protein
MRIRIPEPEYLSQTSSSDRYLPVQACLSPAGHAAPAQMRGAARGSSAGSQEATIVTVVRVANP